MSEKTEFIEIVSSYGNLPPITISDLIALCEQAIAGNYALVSVTFPICGLIEEGKKAQQKMDLITQAIEILAEAEKI